MRRLSVVVLGLCLACLLLTAALASSVGFLATQAPPGAIQATLNSTPGSFATVVSNASDCSGGSAVTSLSCTTPTLSVGQVVTVWGGWYNSALPSTITGSSANGNTITPEASGKCIDASSNGAFVLRMPVTHAGADTVTLTFASGVNFPRMNFAVITAPGGYQLTGADFVGCSPTLTSATLSITGTAAPPSGGAGDVLVSVVNVENGTPTTIGLGQTWLVNNSGDADASWSQNTLSGVVSHSYTYSSAPASAAAAAIIAEKLAPVGSQPLAVALSSSSYSAASCPGSAGTQVSQAFVFGGDGHAASLGLTGASKDPNLSLSATNMPLANVLAGSSSSVCGNAYSTLVTASQDAGLHKATAPLATSYGTRTISGISPTTGSFNTGGGTGQTVATMTATMSDSSNFTSDGGTWSLVASGGSCSGGDTTDFSINASTGVVTNNTTTAGTYTTCPKATLASATNSPQYQTLTITGSSSSGTISPNAVFVADDTTTDMSIAWFRYPGQTFMTSDSCNWSENDGNPVAQAARYQLPGDPFGISACGIQTYQALNSGFDGTYTGTISGTANGHSFSQTVTITVGNPANLGAAPNIHDMLIAWGNGQAPPPSLTYANGTVSDVYMTNGGGYGCNPSYFGLGSGRMQDVEIDPVVADGGAGCSATNWSTAATGGYNSLWQNYLTSGPAQTLYNSGWLSVVLIMNEWQGNCGVAYSPYWNDSDCSGSTSPPSPATVVAALQNFISTLHSVFPKTKVQMQAPLGAGCDVICDANYFPPSLWNGSSSAVDMTGQNLYFYNVVGGTPQDVWFGYTCVQPQFGSGCGWSKQAAWAQETGLPTMTNEFCDAFQNDSYTYPRAIWYMAQNSQLLSLQWVFDSDTPDTVSANNDCLNSIGEGSGNGSQNVAALARILGTIDYTAKYLPGCTSGKIAYPGGGTCPAE